MRYDPVNFGELARRAALLYPDKVVIEQGDLELTYGELERRTRQVAALLAREGVARGERVLILLANDFRFPEILLGTLRAGAIAVPVNIKLGAEQLAYIADHSESVAVIGQREFVDSLPAYQRTFVVGDDYDDAVALMDSGFDSAVVAETDEALLMYTSGSTGRPKGVQLSHANKWWQARSAAETMMWKPSARPSRAMRASRASASWRFRRSSASAASSTLTSASSSMTRTT